MHQTQASCENAITYRAVKQLQRGYCPWGWDLLEDLAHLTVEDPLHNGAGYDLMPDRWKWVPVQVTGLPMLYRRGGQAYPNFKRGMAFNANALAEEVAFRMRLTASAEGGPADDRLLAREWNKALVCWPKLYPTALKLYAQGLYR